MITIIILIFITFFLYLNTKTRENFKFKNNFFKLVVTTYNSEEYIEKCLKSIQSQQYKNYHVCVVDDASTKKRDYIRNIIQKYCKKNNWNYIFQNQNLGPLESRINAINKLKCCNDDILVFIDGDDQLSNNKVLDILNNYYQEDIYVTFGSYLNSYNNIKSKPKIKCIDNLNSLIKLGYTRKRWLFSHLKTMKYFIYKHINHEKSLKINGRYFRSATDMALMYPAIELAGYKIKCIPEVLYYYTLDHPESFHNNTNIEKKNSQRKNSKIIRQMPKYKSLFYDLI